MTRCDSARPQAPARLISIATSLTAPGALAALARRTFLLGLLAGFGGAASLAQLQPGPPAGHRPFPPQALRGELVVGAVPAALLNGQAARLAPGARIRGEDNLLRLPTSLAGQPLIVHYTLEPSSGLVMDVWILNRAELANEPWPTSPAEAATWRFNPASQRWARP